MIFKKIICFQHSSKMTLSQFTKINYGVRWSTGRFDSNVWGQILSRPRLPDDFPLGGVITLEKGPRISSETGWNVKFFIPDGHGRVVQVKMIKLTCPQGSFFFSFNHHTTFFLFLFHSIEPISNEKSVTEVKMCGLLAWAWLPSVQIQFRLLCLGDFNIISEISFVCSIWRIRIG